MASTIVSDMITTLERVHSITTHGRYAEATKDVLPVTIGKTIDELTKHLQSLRYLSLVLCGYVSPNTLPAVRCPELEESLKKQQNHERLSSIVDCLVHTTVSNRYVIVLKVRLTRAFDAYAANAFLPDNFRPDQYKDILFNYASVEDNADSIVRTFVLSAISRCISSDIKLGLLSSGSLLESLKVDIHHIQKILDHVPKPHHVESICLMKPENITLHM